MIFDMIDEESRRARALMENAIDWIYMHGSWDDRDDFRYHLSHYIGFTNEELDELNVDDYFEI